jgi:hypothetical protein
MLISQAIRGKSYGLLVIGYWGGERRSQRSKVSGHWSLVIGEEEDEAASLFAFLKLLTEP